MIIVPYSRLFERSDIMNRLELAANFIESVEKTRISMGLTQQEMAKELGMSVSGYKKMVLGQTSKIDLFVAYRMYEITGQLLYELCGESERNLAEVQRYRALSKRQKSFVHGVVDFEYEFQESVSLPDQFLSVYVPTGNVEDGMIWDSTNIEKVNAAAYFEKFGDALNCGVKVTSNHLHPVYHEGDILLICRKAPRDGDTGIFLNKENGRMYIRRFRQTEPCRLEPINNYGNVIEIDSHSEKSMNKWIKFGRVLTKMRI